MSKLQRRVCYNSKFREGVNMSDKDLPKWTNPYVPKPVDTLAVRVLGYWVIIRMTTPKDPSKTFVNFIEDLLKVDGVKEVMEKHDFEFKEKLE